MPRTTADEVRKIIEVDTLITDLDPFISAANELVTEVCEPLGYTESRLTLIETWLAAHFYAIRDPRLSSEQAGPVGASYQSRLDLGLNVTHYGQQAMRLDTKGGLGKLENDIKKGGTRKIGVYWLGTEREAGTEL